MKPVLRRIASSWYVKVLGQNAMGLIPFGLGRRASQYVAELVQGPLQERPTAGVYRIRRSLRNLDLLRRHTGMRLEGRSVLELGTGWRGADAFLLHLLGTRTVITLDHQRWLRGAAFQHTIELVGEHFDEVLDLVTGHTTAEAARTRLAAAVSRARAGVPLDELLNGCGIRYEVVPSADPARITIPPGSVDLFYTESVLQRIPERTLERILDHVSLQLMAPDGAFFHRTDQRDIHTIEHAGNRHWGLAYLGYSDWVFRTFISGRFTSQNRLRESDFLALLERRGFRPRYVESRICPDDLERLKGFRLARRFRDKTAEDIVTRASLIAGVFERPGASAPRQARGMAAVRERFLGTIAEVES